MQDVNVTMAVRSRSAQELADKISLMTEIASRGVAVVGDRAQPTAPAESATESPTLPPLIPPPGERPPISSGAYMKVGDVTVKPGETAKVPVIGGSGRNPVDGISFAMGFGRRLKEPWVKLGEFLQNYLGSDVGEWTQVHNDGKPEPHFVYLAAFFSPQNIKGMRPAIVIPADTVLFTIEFRIPEDTPPMTIKLFSADNWFWRTSEGHRAQIMFTRMEVGDEGVNVDIESGSITVVAADDAK